MVRGLTSKSVDPGSNSDHYGIEFAKKLNVASGCLRLSETLWRSLRDARG